jgi:hypothetical protein
MTKQNILIDSGDPYEMYRHLAIWADYYAIQYKEYGILPSNVTIKEIE